MLKRYIKSDRSAARKTRLRSRRPEAEALEGRMLLYATIGNWTYSSRITYSFMPDGTNIQGQSSVLFQKFNALAPTATWEGAIEQAASTWEASANLNLALVSDNGAASPSGDQQDDPRFGDIRIGAVPLPSGVLAETFLPPPSNGGSLAGDIVFNSTINFQIGGGIDLQSIALHEFGHSLGLGDQSTDPNGVMYYNYNGVKTSLDSDDIAGIQSLYGAPQYDCFNTGLLKNSTTLTATNIMPYMNSANDQIALSGLDNTTAGQQENYVVTVPSGAAANMVVTLQSSNLSSLAPALNVLNSSLAYVAQLAASTTYGATLTATIPVSAGQKYYIKVASTGAYGRVGAYGLEVNFGTQAQSPIAPPNTLVADQPDQGGGSMNNALTVGGQHGGALSLSPGLAWTTIGNYTGWMETYTVGSGAVTSPATQPPAAQPPAASSPTVPASGVAGPVAPVAPPSSPTTAPLSTNSAPIAPLTSSSGSGVTQATGSHKLAHHAVDATLRGWTGHRRRPHSGAKVRSARHEHDPLS